VLSDSTVGHLDHSFKPSLPVPHRAQLERAARLCSLQPPRSVSHRLKPPTSSPSCALEHLQSCRLRALLATLGQRPPGDASHLQRSPPPGTSPRTGHLRHRITRPPQATHVVALMRLGASPTVSSSCSARSAGLKTAWGRQPPLTSSTAGHLTTDGPPPAPNHLAVTSSSTPPVSYCSPPSPPTPAASPPVCRC
jgi:hypothetical protein